MSSGCSCTICLELCLEDLHVTQCGHVFHRSCIYRWIDRESSCPNCKKFLNAALINKLFLQPLDAIATAVNDPESLEQQYHQLLSQHSNKQNTNNSSTTDINQKLQIASLNTYIKEIQNQAKVLQSKLSNARKTNESFKNEIKILTTSLLKYKQSANDYSLKCFDMLEDIKHLNSNITKTNIALKDMTCKYKSEKENRNIYKHISAILDKNKYAVEQMERDMSKMPERKRMKKMVTLYVWMNTQYKSFEKEKKVLSDDHEKHRKFMRNLHIEQRDEINLIAKAHSETMTKYEMKCKQFKKFRKEMKSKLSMDCTSNNVNIDIDEDIDLNFKAKKCKNVEKYNNNENYTNFSIIDNDGISSLNLQQNSNMMDVNVLQRKRNYNSMIGGYNGRGGSNTNIIRIRKYTKRRKSNEQCLNGKNKKEKKGKGKQTGIYQFFQKS